MRRVLLSIITCLFFQSAMVSAEDVPNYSGPNKNNPEDIKAINKVIEDFQRAIKEHDGELFSSLVLHENIMFSNIPQQRDIDWLRKELDIDFLKKYPEQMIKGAKDFKKFISTSKDEIEERFFNIKIDQDLTFGVVTFDYDFRINGKVNNWGIESWQMIKVDEKWRIATVLWSVNRAPKAEK